MSSLFKRAAQKTAFALAIVLISTCPVDAQDRQNRAEKTQPSTNERIYTVAELAEDLQRFRDVLAAQHPGLHRYAVASEFESAADSVAESLEPMDELAFYGRLLPLIDKVYDGHTQFDISNDLSERLADQRMRLPYRLKVLNGRAFIDLDYTANPDAENALPRGSELLAINGNPMSEVIQKMLPLYTSDGRNVTLKYRRMSSTFWFGLRYRILYGATEEFKVKVRDRSTGKIRELTVSGITGGELSQRYQQRYAADEQPAINASLVVEDGLAILRLATMESRTLAGVRFDRYFEQAFQRMKDEKVRTLVIDLRGNGGGIDEIGRVLFQHLTHANFRYYRRLSRLDERGRLQDVDHGNLGVHKPRSPNYQGKVYILMDGGTFSAASEFITVAHHLGRATTVGEEGGGGYRGNTSGSINFIQLPNTGLRMVIPRTLYEMAIDNDTDFDRGAIPDIPVLTTIDDVLDGRDPVLDLVKKRHRESID